MEAPEINTTSYESDSLILRKPTIADKGELLDYRQEFIDNGEVGCGDGELINTENIDEWFKKIEIYSNDKTVPKNRVAATQFIAVRKSDNKIVGMVNVRHRLNETLLLYGGHIGDNVRKSERGKGYATEQICLALKFCKKLGIDKVLITCDRENIASRKSIIKNNGVKENEVFVDGITYERFWVLTGSTEICNTDRRQLI